MKKALNFAASKLEKTLFEIDWESMSAEQVYNLWRGVCGLGKLHSVWKDTRAVVHFDDGVNPDLISKLRIEINGGKNCRRETAESETFKPGRTIYVKRGKQRFLCIKCVQGWAGFNQFVIGSSHKVLAPVDFFNGFISQHRDKRQFFVNPEKLRRLWKNKCKPWACLLRFGWLKITLIGIDFQVLIADQAYQLFWNIYIWSFGIRQWPGLSTIVYRSYSFLSSLDSWKCCVKNVINKTILKPPNSI